MIEFWSDLLCPFAYVELLRLRRARARLGLDVRIEHHRQVILEVASAVPQVDVDELAAAHDDGRHRKQVMADFTVAGTDAIAASPTLRFTDGTTVTNPGIDVHWQGPWAEGFPVVDAHDAAVYDELLLRAA